MAIPQTEVSHLELSHTVCSVSQFLERLKGIRLSEDEVMVSFDVTSLFTSIPQCLSVKTVRELLECKYDETDESVKRTHLIQLLKVCLKTFFTFEGRVYEQIKGRRWDHRFQSSSQKQFSKSIGNERSANQVSEEQVSALSEYLVGFCRTRLKLLSFYAMLIDNEALLSCSARNLCSGLAELQNTFPRSKNLLDSVFSPLTAVIKRELGLLISLLDVQFYISNLHFLNALLCLRSLSKIIKDGIIPGRSLQDFAYLGHSYVAPVAVGNPPTGVESLPPILTIPPEAHPFPADDVSVIMTKICSVLSLDASEQPRRILTFFDPKIHKTFFLAKIEPRIYFVSVCPKNQLANTQIISFLNRIGDAMQLIEIRTSQETYMGDMAQLIQSNRLALKAEVIQGHAGRGEVDELLTV
nr:unnamed protein product [Spirometra erinaceieuropaei]